MPPVSYLLMMLLKAGFCQEQAFIPQASGTNVHVMVCSFVEPRDMTEEEKKKAAEREGHDPAGAVGTPTQPGQKRA